MRIKLVKAQLGMRADGQVVTAVPGAAIAIWRVRDIAADARQAVVAEPDVSVERGLSFGPELGFGFDPLFCLALLAPLPFRCLQPAVFERAFEVVTRSLQGVARPEWPTTRRRLWSYDDAGARCCGRSGPRTPHLE